MKGFCKEKMPDILAADKIICRQIRVLFEISIDSKMKNWYTIKALQIWPSA